MHDSTTGIGMDVHKESILVAAVNGAGATAARWETPNTAKMRGAVSFSRLLCGIQWIDPINLLFCNL